MVRMITLLALLVTSDIVLADYPRFRGPAGNGVVEKADLPTTWSDTKNLAWTAKLSGTGWSQPVVIGQTVYVTACFTSGIRSKKFTRLLRQLRTPDSDASNIVATEENAEMSTTTRYESWSSSGGKRAACEKQRHH